MTPLIPPPLQTTEKLPKQETIKVLDEIDEVLMARKVKPPLKSEEDLVYWAWTIIANAYGGDWSKASPEWREAAKTWRNVAHDWMDVHGLTVKVKEGDLSAPRESSRSEHQEPESL